MTAMGGWRTGLPVPLTRPVGREREPVGVARPKAAGRLVTLAGAGGAGKTQLAVEVAAAVSAEFADGVVVADLSAVADAALFAALFVPGGGTRGGRHSSSPSCLPSPAAVLRSARVWAGNADLAPCFLRFPRAPT